MTDELRVGLLGPVEAHRDGSPVDLPGPKASALLAMLALQTGRVVSTSALIDGLWGDRAGDGARATLQVHVSNLRKAVGPDAVETRSPGYLLTVPTDGVDLLCSEAELRAAVARRATGDLAGARDRVARALVLWRGRPLEDVAEVPFARAAIPWLEERWALAVEELADLDLVRGDHRAAVADLEVAAARWPHRERLWALLMVALYRSGRQADALAAYQRARTELAEGSGLEPGPELRRLEAAVLSQDGALDLPAGEERASSPPGWETTMPAWGAAVAALDLGGGRRHLLTGPVVLGRGPDCDIVLTDGGVSRRHAEVRPTVAGVLLTDLGSTNGTLVGGVPVQRHVLVDGDEVRIGDHLLTLSDDPPPTPT